MTAEVVIMNTNGVAMAADSAATAGFGTPYKQTYYNVNKLFDFSPEHSVGVMIYGGASFHSVPWETIIKMYRESLTGSFGTLEEYAKNFIEFFENNNENFVPVSKQLDELQKNCVLAISNIDFSLSNEWNVLKDKNIDIKEFINSRLAEFSDIKYVIPKWKDENHKKELFAIVAKQVKDFLANHASRYQFVASIDGEHHNLLCEAVFAYLVKFPPFEDTGIVFVGYGKNDVFPCAYSFDVNVYYLGEFSIKNIHIDKIEHNNRVAILPFAERHMIDTFMVGIHPLHNDMIQKTINSSIGKMPEFLIDKIFEKISSLSDKEKNKIKSELLSENIELKKLPESINKNLNNYYTIYSSNIVSGISLLPKDELADVAGSLLRLSTLQKQVTLGDDSVGGEIDVAVISKGDGFVWVKSKHYFDSALNRGKNSLTFPYICAKLSIMRKNMLGEKMGCQGSFSLLVFVLYNINRK